MPADEASTALPVFSAHGLSLADEAALTEFRRRHVGFVFQFYSLIPSLTVRRAEADAAQARGHRQPHERRAVNSPARTMRAMVLSDRQETP